jgi:hypothetical protein
MLVSTIDKNRHSSSRNIMMRYIDASRGYIVIDSEKLQKEEQRAQLREKSDFDEFESVYGKKMSKNYEQQWYH